MKTTRFGQALVLAASLLAFGAVPAASTKDLDEAMSHDGLQKIKVKGVALAYAQPGATLADYRKVRIDPVQVAFRKDFDPTKTGSRMKLSTEELEDIRTGVGKLVYEEFVKALQKEPAYAVTNAAGPDVLQLRIAIANLYVNAPDTMEPGRSRTFTTSAGEMTLILEMVDSETGAVLARVIDRREARDTGMMMWTNSATNTAEARYMASRWAKILRERFDAAHGIGKQ